VAPESAAVLFENVSIGFEDREVLRNFSFFLQKGETKVLLGESGAGKTVLLKLAAGLIRPDAGQIQVAGTSLGEMSETDLLAFRGRIGFVFQEGALFDSLTVRDNVAFRLQEERMPSEEVEARVREVLRFVEMEDSIDKFPADLSGGMRRRVSIARALVGRPEVVFYDSPTAGLDPVTSQTIIALILRLRDLQGVTALLATHRVQDFFGLANFRFDKEHNRVVANSSEPNASPAVTNVLLLRDGGTGFEGNAAAVLKSADPYLNQFLVSAR
jgi:phospholipid/cholesterol/gamma-HCH transport system ATP-binding protein